MVALSQTSVSENIALLKDLANLCYPTNHVLAELTFIQGILEAGLRRAPPSLLALKYNNLFGIKGNGTKGHINLPTNEYINKKWIRVKPKNQVFNGDSFAWNASIEDSLAQHKRLLERTRYVKVALAKTFEEAATEVWKAGYATDPKYPQLLIDLHKHYVGRK